LSGFTSDPREVCSCLYDLETVVCKSFSIPRPVGLGRGLEGVWGTRGAQSREFMGQGMCLGCKGCTEQGVYPAGLQQQRGTRGTGYPESPPPWLYHPKSPPSPPLQEMYAFFSSLDTKGTNYKYEVSLSGPAVELHNCMAKLLAHPLQRPFQTHAAYGLLEEDEPPEIEATV
ncbi:BABA1 protein, partial [Piaya cayana]|nr:BABA1 protein [Piaya cayana]